MKSGKRDSRIATNCSIALAALIVAAAAIALAPIGRAQAPADQFEFNSRSIASFTAAQAAAGKEAYAKNCASCHGTTLNGSEFASALRGITFTNNWGGRSAVELFNYMNTKMPPASPGSLGAETYAQVEAFLLQSNGVQPGQTELPTDPQTLATMTIPRGATARSAPMMPLSPLAPPMPVVKLPDPLVAITPVTAGELENPPASEWLIWRRGYNDQGFSPLAQINKSNVSDLRVKWAWSLPPGENDATPLEHDGVLFVDAYGDHVEALNAVTGDLLWEYSRLLPSDARLSQKRAIALFGDRLFAGTSDDHIVALDVKTGSVIWDSPVADYKKGFQLTGGPLVAKGKVLQGVGGQSAGGNFIVALDMDTGKEAWRFHTIAQQGEPGDSWNGLPNDKRNGASVWTPGSYDPQLGLAYFGVGQTYDTGPVLHRVPGFSNDGLYTDST
ncbi:MAG TPA: PQQ-binding-like beta-propeller repeat protein, partial [Candidatus Baltobacteraceae bacterium]|nr:PQQ-binding-like beta-propeller repeat protein [Candidatus Baltobacteraceae bacterium]